MKKKRALVVMGGGFKGAYCAGVLSTLCRELGPDYFDRVYASSVGSYVATFYVANQPDFIENTWRNLVCGRQLFSLLHLFKWKDFLDLAYLKNIFSHKESLLDINRVINSHTKIEYLVTRKKDGKSKYISPNKKYILDYMNASCSIPFFSEPVRIGKDEYIDGGFSGDLFLSKVIKDGCNEIIVVCNFMEGEYKNKLIKKIIRAFLVMFSPAMLQIAKSSSKKYGRFEKLIKDHKNIKIIRPKKPLPLKSIFDTNKERLNKTIDLGHRDALRFLKNS